MSKTLGEIVDGVMGKRDKTVSEAERQLASKYLSGYKPFLMKFHDPYPRKDVKGTHPRLGRIAGCIHNALVHTNDRLHDWLDYQLDRPVHTIYYQWQDRREVDWDKMPKTITYGNFSYPDLNIDDYLPVMAPDTDASE